VKELSQLALNPEVVDRSNILLDTISTMDAIVWSPQADSDAVGALLELLGTTQAIVKLE
jgi:hypothetical protein